MIETLLVIGQLALLVATFLLLRQNRRHFREQADIKRQLRNMDGDLEAFNERIDALANVEVDTLREQIERLREEERIYDQAELDAITARLLEKQSRKMYVCLDCDSSIVTSAVLEKCGDCGGNNFEIRGPVAS